MTKVTICASMTQCNDGYNDTDHAVDDFKSHNDNDEVEDDNDDDDDDNGDDNDDDNGDGNAFSWPSSRPSLSAPPLSCEQDCPPSCKYDHIDEEDDDDDVDEEDDDRNRTPRLLKPEDRSRPLVDDMACNHLNISS